MYYAQTTPFDVVDHFEITTPATLPLGEEAPSIIIRAVDHTGQTVEDYVGSTVFSSSDPNAALPNFGRYTFKERDLGQKEFPLVLKFDTNGTQTLRVEDANDPSIFGQATIQVEGHGSANTPIEVSSPRDGDTVNATSITVNGKGPRFANLIVMGGAQDVNGATDKDGNFSIPIVLNTDKKEFTIRVRDDAGHNDSGPINITIDRTPPTIGIVTFSPEKPKPGDTVLAIVQSEPNLSEVTLSFGDTAPDLLKKIKLQNNSTASGSYQAFFTAPPSGAFQPAVHAVDRAGNVTDIRTMLIVGTPGLPTVQNLHGTPRMNAVDLEWDALGQDVDGYRIYVGEKPDNFEHTLDTGRAVTKATVAGLTPGQTYSFAVTALKDGNESDDKSQVFSAETPGLVLKVTEDDTKLLIEWLPPKVPLQSYKLEYGIKENVYTEKRSIVAKKDDAGPQAYTVTDLLNGVPYFFKLTPITITGDPLTDLAVKGSGKPNGSGFETQPGDTLPFIPGSSVLAHTPVNASSGLPAMAWMSIALIAMAGGFCQWHRNRTLRQTTAFLSAIQSRYHR